MNVDRWRGIHTIMITPFKPDFSLDLDGHRQNVRFAAESRAHVLVCLGTQGEFSSLSVEERRAVMRVTVEETQGRKPVICGVGSSSTLEAVALSRHARELGADAVMAVPPYFAEVTTEGVVDHFRRIVTDARIPLFLYNAPARAGFNLTPQLLERLATIDVIVGVKQATRNVTELEETVALVGLRVAVIGGAEAMIWPALALGMIGSTSTAASFMPDPMTANLEAMCLYAWSGGFELFGGTTDGKVYFSDDGAQSWRLIADDLAPVSKVEHYRLLLPGAVSSRGKRPDLPRRTA